MLTPITVAVLKTYRQIGKLTRAIADFDRSIELNPNDASAYNNRGVAYGLQGTHDRAIKDFNRAIELNRGGSYYNQL